MQVSPWTAPLRVKLCGIRSRSDLAVALNAGDQSIAAAIAAEPLVDALLLDYRTADRIGGLRPENLQAALKIVGPTAVDVNSGIEDVTGAKDPQRAVAFVQICRR